MVAGGKALLHVRTARRRWLLELSGSGLTVYQATWNKARRCYVRGALVGRAQLRGSVLFNGWSFDYERVGLPFGDIMARFCPAAWFSRIGGELEALPPSEATDACCEVIRRMAEVTPKP